MRARSDLLHSRKTLFTILSALSLACEGALAPPEAAAQAFPSKPVRIIVPNAPGGPSDLISRLIAPKLQETWGQPVIAENRAGGDGLIAAEFISKQPPDGHVMLPMALSQLIGTLVAQRLVLSSDFAPITFLGATPFAVTVNASLPTKNFAEFVAYAKANDGKLAYSSTGNWGANHLCMETINQIIGVKMLHVPYPGSPQATQALLANDVQVFCGGAPNLAALAKQGKIRPLAITYAKPTKLVPDVPPVADTLPGYELLGWFGMETTKGTPAEIISKLNADLGRALRDPIVYDKIYALGVELQPNSVAEFSAFLKSEGDRWGKFLKEHGAKPGS